MSDPGPLGPLVNINKHVPDGRLPGVLHKCLAFSWPKISDLFFSLPEQKAQGELL